MVVTKALIFKGLGLAGAVGALVPAIYYRNYLMDLLVNPGEKELLERLGIVCTETSCTLKDGSERNLTVVLEGGKKITISSPWSTGKGKLLKLDGRRDGDAGNYRYGLKFLIEGGDIDLGNGDKMEEFETYEINRESWSRNSSLFLSRKNKSNVEKEKKLGLPEGCNLPLDQRESTCSNLNALDLERMNFSWKNKGTPKIEGNNPNIALRIERVNEEEKTTFQQGYKLTLESNSKITFPREGGEEILEANTGTEFTIFKLSSDLKLKRAWTLEQLAKKAGFSSCSPDDNSCDFGDTINLFIGEDNHTEGASINDGDKAKKMTVTKEAGYNQGFKFTTSSEIVLNGGNPSATDKKIEVGSSYEVNGKTIGGSRKWFLVKK